jgi:hypothetical protein
MELSEMNKIFPAIIAGVTLAASVISVSPAEARGRGGYTRHMGGGHGFGGRHFGGHHGFGMGRHFGGHRGYYGGGRGYGGGRYYYGDDYGYDDGAIGAGILGLAAGAMIGSALSHHHHHYSSGGSCAARFRSYNRATGTYLGNDGRRHHCP